MVTRSGSTGSELVVYYAISGTATNRIDYNRLTGIVKIPRGKRTATIEVTPKRDHLNEGVEMVVLQLIPTSRYAPATNANWDVVFVLDR